jgi:hypothetical protein
MGPFIVMAPAVAAGFEMHTNTNNKLVVNWLINCIHVQLKRSPGHLLS